MWWGAWLRKGGSVVSYGAGFESLQLQLLFSVCFLPGNLSHLVAPGPPSSHNPKRDQKNNHFQREFFKNLVSVYHVLSPQPLMNKLFCLLTHKPALSWLSKYLMLQLHRLVAVPIRGLNTHHFLLSTSLCCWEESNSEALYCQCGSKFFIGGTCYSCYLI